MDFIETSAKTNANVNEGFSMIATHIIARLEGKGEVGKGAGTPGSVDIKKGRKDEEKASCPC